jgi:hypothetical protein
VRGQPEDEKGRGLAEVPGQVSFVLRLYS